MVKKNLLAIAVVASLGSGYCVNPSVYLNHAADKRSCIAKSKGKRSKKDRRR